MIDKATGWYFVPASIKGVVIDDGRVLLCRNPRDEWELPGGWPQQDDSGIQETVEREVLEESGLRVKAGELLHAGWLVVTAEPVVIVALRATVVGTTVDLAHSPEHSDVRFFDVDQLPEAVPEIYREAIRAAVAA